MARRNLDEAVEFIALHCQAEAFDLLHNMPEEFDVDELMYRL